MEMTGVEVPLAVNSHLLQHTLRSLCGALQYSTATGHGGTATTLNFWVYSIFWRILPRNYPPPRWDHEAGNKRNWILVWEDGYCDFVACSRELEAQESKKESKKAEVGNGEEQSKKACSSGPLQPELFFKMSHDVYNYGEGLMGKVAAEKSHKWIFRDAMEDEDEDEDAVPLLSAWQASAESQYPRTWEKQFKAGIQTIAIISVGEGLLQLGSMKKVPQDVDFVLMLQRKFSYLQSIPGVFAQTKIVRAMNMQDAKMARENIPLNQFAGFKRAAHPDSSEEDEACSSYPLMPLSFPALPNPVIDVPSMYNSLQALLSKLPAVIKPDAASSVNAATVKVGAAASIAAPHAEAEASKIMAQYIPTSASSITEGNSPSLTAGSLCSPLPVEVWSNLRRPPPPLRAPSSASNLILPHLPDELEAYHSLFG